MHANVTPWLLSDILEKKKHLATWVGGRCRLGNLQVDVIQSKAWHKKPFLTTLTQDTPPLACTSFASNRWRTCAPPNERKLPNELRPEISRLPTISNSRFRAGDPMVTLFLPKTHGCGKEILFARLLQVPFQAWDSFQEKHDYGRKGTLPKPTIAPENRPSQKENHVPTINFQGRKCC